VTDLTADQVIDRCRSFWLSSGVETDGVQDMTAELRSHLEDTLAAGRDLETVTGPNIEEFADEWASASQGPRHQAYAAQEDLVPPPVTSTASPPATWGLWLGTLAIVAGVAAVAVFAPKDDTLEQGLWTGVWFVAAAVLAVGEMLTAGFFLLPFGAGAIASGLLTLTGVGVAVELITFVVVSLLSLFLLQRFARKDIHGELLPVGAARYVGTSALVTEPVNRLRGTGQVKMGTEDWRATTNSNVEIPEGAEVLVTEVRGARLVVEQRIR